MSPWPKGRPRKVVFNEETEENNMVENNSVQDTIAWLKDKLLKQESELEALKRKPAGSGKRKFQITGANNNVESEFEDDLQARNAYADSHPEPVMLRKEEGFVGKENECPYCTSQKKDSLLDKNKTGRYACRRCSKSWHERNLGKPYSLALERDYDGNLVTEKVA